MIDDSIWTIQILCSFENIRLGRFHCRWHHISFKTQSTGVKSAFKIFPVPSFMINCTTGFAQLVLVLRNNRGTGKNSLCKKYKSRRVVERYLVSAVRNKLYNCQFGFLLFRVSMTVKFQVSCITICSLCRALLFSQIFFSLSHTELSCCWRQLIAEMLTS